MKPIRYNTDLLKNIAERKVTKFQILFNTRINEKL